MKTPLAVKLLAIVRKDSNKKTRNNTKTHKNNYKLKDNIYWNHTPSERQNALFWKEVEVGEFPETHKTRIQSEVLGDSGLKTSIGGKENALLLQSTYFV